MNLDYDEINIIQQYDENDSIEIPLPQPPLSAIGDFGKVANITVPFLPCNQIFITYGFIVEVSKPVYLKLVVESCVRPAHKY